MQPRYLRNFEMYVQVAKDTDSVVLCLPVSVVFQSAFPSPTGICFQHSNRWFVVKLAENAFYQPPHGWGKTKY